MGPVHSIKFVHAIISKNTGKWNTIKEQPFFNRKPYYFKAQRIFNIKPPHSHFGKPNIPNNKWYSHNGAGQQKSAKILVKSDSPVKRSYKTDDNSKKINEKIGVRYHFLLKYILKY